MKRFLSQAIRVTGKALLLLLDILLTFIAPPIIWVLKRIDEVIFLRSVGSGAACRFENGGTRFWGVGREARKVVKKVCKGRFRRGFTGGYFVPEQYHNEVYEAIMHDPEHPQCMSCESILLGCTVIDTP